MGKGRVQRLELKESYTENGKHKRDEFGQEVKKWQGEYSETPDLESIFGNASRTDLGLLGTCL